MLAHDTKDHRRTPLRTLRAALVNSLFGSNRGSIPVEADLEQAEKDLVRQLKGRKKIFRGRSGAGSDHPAIESLRQIRKRRRLSVRESESLFQLSRNRPRDELNLYFAPGGAEISPAAEPALKRLGEALTHADLHGKAFLIAGHTCRRGGVERSTELSIARAESIKRYLVENFDIDPDALLPHGYGFRYLKNPQNAFAQENHRFEIVNLSE